MTTDTIGSRAERTPLLTAEEEVALAHRIAAGLVWDDDERKPVPRPGATQGQLADAREAAEAFTSANLRLAYQAARARQGSLNDAHGLEFDDLLAEAVRVLIEHVYRFDPARGYRFSSFAGGKSGPIARAIGRLLYTEGNPVRLTHRVYALMAKARTYIDTCERADGRTPPEDEVAAHCGVTVAYLRAKMADLPTGFVPMDRHNSNDQAAIELADDGPEPDELVAAEDGVRAVWVALDALDADVREVISLRFGFATGQPESLDAVGEKLGMSWRQVTNLEQRGIAILRENGTLAGLL